MMGPRKQRATKLFYTGIDLEERVPADHRLRRIAEAVSFERVRPTVAGCYGGNGHESVDPVVLLKLMLLLFIEQVPSERELMRQLPLRLDWLWFLEMDLDESAPDHSVLSKARRLWGLSVFEALFGDVLDQCVAAGLVDGQTLHADSTVLEADASVNSRVARKLWRQLETGLAPQGGEGDDEDDPSASPRDDASDVERTPPPPQDTQFDDLPSPPRGPFNARTVSATDPDAATTRRRGRSVTLGYRDHCLVDDRHGVITATIATAADYDDASMLPLLLDEHHRRLGHDPQRVTGDQAYGTRANVQHLSDRGVRPYLKPRTSGRSRGHWLDRMPPQCPPGAACHWLSRRLAVGEGRFAAAKTRHGHRRCRWRRRWRVQIQCYLVAMTQNLLKLARRRRPRPAHAIAQANPRAAAIWTRIAQRRIHATPLLTLVATTN